MFNQKKCFTTPGYCASLDPEAEVLKLLHHEIAWQNMSSRLQISMNMPQQRWDLIQLRNSIDFQVIGIRYGLS